MQLKRRESDVFFFFVAGDTRIAPADFFILFFGLDLDIEPFEYVKYVLFYHLYSLISKPERKETLA